MSDTSDTTSTSAARATAAFHYLRSVLGPLLALAVVVVFFAAVDYFWSEGQFASGRNVRTMAVQTCVVAVAALGMTAIIISGGIDLSAGAALALCATTLAWGLREDVAVLISYGGNYAGVSRSLERAQRELTLAQEGNDEVLQEAWSSRARHGREKLTRIAEQKLGRIERLAQSASAEADRSRFTRDAERMRQRIAQLKDESFVLKADSAWLEGVPNSGWSAPLSIAIAIATGLLAGLVNGALISTLRVVPFIVTLGTMTIFLGLGNLLSGNVPIRPSVADQVPAWLPAIVSNSESALWFGFPAGVWLALVLAIALALVLRFTVFGRHLFALGSSEATARLCGINVPATKIAIYVLGGLFIGVAGIYQFSRLSTGNPMAGAGMELKIIAAVIIGGASLSGGRGTVLGTLAGAAIMAVIDSGCTQLGLDDPIQRIILGVIIIGAVVLDQLRQRRSGG